MAAATKTMMMSEESLDSQCPVCLDDINNMAHLDCCKHKFCFCCIREWSKNKARCPLCKKSFSLIFHSFSGENEFEEFVVKPPGYDSFDSTWNWNLNRDWPLWELDDGDEYTLLIENILEQTPWDNDTPESTQSIVFSSPQLELLHGEGTAPVEEPCIAWDCDEPTAEQIPELVNLSSHAEGSVCNEDVAPVECSQPAWMPSFTDFDRSAMSTRRARNKRKSQLHSQSHSQPCLICDDQSHPSKSHRQLRLRSRSPSSTNSPSTCLRSRHHHQPGRKRKHNIEELEHSVREGSSRLRSSAGLEMKKERRRRPRMHKKCRKQNGKYSNQEQILRYSSHGRSTVVMDVNCNSDQSVAHTGHIIPISSICPPPLRATAMVHNHRSLICESLHMFLQHGSSKH